jgi:hypothetical protein
MSSNSLKLSLSVVAFVAATSCAMAQSATGTATGTTSTQGSMQAMPKADGTTAGKMGRSSTDGDLSNSQKSLENGTASGKGSGPRAGSPNGN